MQSSTPEVHPVTGCNSTAEIHHNPLHLNDQAELIAGIIIGLVGFGLLIFWTCSRLNRHEYGKYEDDGSSYYSGSRDTEDSVVHYAPTSQESLSNTNGDDGLGIQFSGSSSEIAVATNNGMIFDIDVDDSDGSLLSYVSTVPSEAEEEFQRFSGIHIMPAEEGSLQNPMTADTEDGDKAPTTPQSTVVAYATASEVSLAHPQPTSTETIPLFDTYFQPTLTSSSHTRGSSAVSVIKSQKSRAWTVASTRSNPFDLELDGARSPAGSDPSDIALRDFRDSNATTLFVGSIGSMISVGKAKVMKFKPLETTALIVDGAKKPRYATMGSDKMSQSI